MKWRAGSGLHIIGSDEAEVVDSDDDDESQSYYVDGFTVKESYEWKLNNAVIQSERNGEFVTLEFPAAGTYTLTVSNGRYSGTKTITVE
jgi:membrane carboxypeptidase/penicillin-binding protein PbpC